MATIKCPLHKEKNTEVNGQRTRYFNTSEKSESTLL